MSTAYTLQCEGATTGECSNHPYNDLQLIDPNGDATFVVLDHATSSTCRYLISSKVLSLASPVFAALFKPHFLEGSRVVRFEQPEIRLGDDDAKPMGVILKILHFKNDDVPLKLEPQLLSSIAIHCNKYDCHRALKPWTKHWLSSTSGVWDCEGIGQLLLSAYLFNDSASFSTISAKFVGEVAPDLVGWDETEEFKFFPPCTTGKFIWLLSWLYSSAEIMQKGYLVE